MYKRQVQQVADIVNAAPYFRHAAVYAEESVNSFHCATNGILCRKDGISWCLSELSEECEVDAAIRDDIRAVALSSCLLYTSVPGYDENL